MSILSRLQIRLGDFWWYSLLIFVACRTGDAIQAFIGLWLESFHAARLAYFVWWLLACSSVLALLIGGHLLVRMRRLSVGQTADML